MEKNTQIGDYTLGKVIGEGASSKVKIAHHDFTNIDVAIKIINKKKMKSSKMSAKIKREIQLLRYLNHPNIIRLYEVLETPEDIFIVMEHISGGELFGSVIKKGRLSEEDARCLFQQILSGVEYCHLNLVAHRDLKPENVLIDSNNVIKITDFGLSNLMKDGKFMMTSCGSPNYAAPEIISGKKYCGAEIDTWSCGVILFTLLTGFLPFDEELLPALFKKIRDADYIIPSYIPNCVADLIRRMLQPEPTKRIKFDRIKKHPWLTGATPFYLQVSLENVRSRLLSKIDEETLKKAMQMGFNFHDFTEEQIKESILKKRDYSFVTGYDLMINQKIKSEITITKSNNQLERERTKVGTLTEENSPCQTKILDDEFCSELKSLDRLNEVGESPHLGQWQYGITYEASPQTIMKAVFEVLAELNTTFTIKSADYKIKCFHKAQKQVYEGSGSVIFDTSYSAQTQHNFQSDAKSPTEEKFSITDIVYNLQIYSIPDSPLEHLVDIQRTKGHSIVFLDYCQSLFHLLTLKIQKFLTQIPTKFSNKLEDDCLEQEMFRPSLGKAVGWDVRFDIPYEYEAYY